MVISDSHVIFPFAQCKLNVRTPNENSDFKKQNQLAIRTLLHVHDAPLPKNYSRFLFVFTGNELKIYGKTDSGCHVYKPSTA